MRISPIVCESVSRYKPSCCGTIPANIRILCVIEGAGNFWLTIHTYIHTLEMNVQVSAVNI